MSDHELVASHLKKANKLLLSYTIGFVLTVIFTLIAFALVRSHTLDVEALYVIVAVGLILQVLVQVFFVFRLNKTTEDDRWNLLIFVFAILIMGIVVSGSLWIMYNLNYYMVN